MSTSISSKRAAGFSLRGLGGKVWRRALRPNLRASKLSMKNLDRLGRENASDGRTLVVYSEFDHERYFPNTVTLPERKNDTHHYYDDLRAVADESFDVVL